MKNLTKSDQFQIKSYDFGITTINARKTFINILLKRVCEGHIEDVVNYQPYFAKTSYTTKIFFRSSGQNRQIVSTGGVVTQHDEGSLHNRHKMPPKRSRQEGV